jgi:hypothetical protein
MVRGEAFMKMTKILSIVLIAIAVILSNIMCAVVAFNYSRILCEIKYTEPAYSYGPGVAYLRSFPYVVAILVLIIMSCVLWKKSKK